MLTLPDFDVVRAVPPRVLMRAEPAADETTTGLGTMEGYFSQFNVWYEIDSWWEGRFLERIAPGAYKKTLAESRDSIKCLYDHGFDPQIGNKVLGSFEDLREDATGGFYAVPLFDTSYNRDLLPGLTGGVYGASMRFRVIKEEWDEEPGKSTHNPEGLPERTIKETRVFELGPVTFPANPGGTAGMRGLTDQYYDQLRSRSPQRHEELVARAVALRGPTDPRTPAPSAELADRAGAAPHDTDEPDAPSADHSSGLTPAARRAVLFPYLNTQEQ